MNFALEHMRKVNQEIKDERVLSEILSGGSICRVAMMDGDLPYIVPFNYGHSDGSLYIHSAPEGKKIDLLGKNNRVCFEVEQAVQVIKREQACDWTTRYRSVVGYGTIDILTDHSSKQHGLKVIMAQYGAPELTDFSPKSLDRMVILKLTITSLTGKQSSNW
jgi:nitroimidazol reductase NimA-like FMN-containing flavoprotein (pyridoxamine 5'-phosphate oxidase superfamily)